MLKWEGINHNHNFDMQRTPIPGGWLVVVENEVITKIGAEADPAKGYEWRTSITFVPDPNHEWILT